MGPWSLGATVCESEIAYEEKLAYIVIGLVKWKFRGTESTGVARPAARATMAGVYMLDIGRISGRRIRCREGGREYAGKSNASRKG